MRSVQKVSTLVRAELVVYDSNNDPVTGLVNGDFTKLLSKDGANSGVAVTVTEIANGRYSVTFTPNATGVWAVLVRHATYNKRGWQEIFDVTTDGVISIADASDGLLDRANGIESGYTLRQVLRLVASILLGKASGGPTGSTFRDLNDSKDRVVATADANGDRTVMTVDPN